jgi:hypothetical protein
MKDKRYCSYCGSEMIRTLIYAEQNMIGISCAGDWAEFPIAHAYDKKTGKRNFSPFYKCPNYENKKWYQVCSPHDSYFIGKVISK